MGYQFIDKAVFFPAEKILIIADLHIGYEQAMNNAGIFLPKQQFARIKEDLGKIFSKTGKVNKIIILGDLKHEFSRNLQQEWGEVLELIEILKKNTKKIVLVKGNHDNYLINAVKRFGIKIVDFYIHNDMAFLHGNKMFPELLDKNIKQIFLGHMHPAITISEGVKRERYKCFLKGKWKDKEIVILPSFFPLVEGADVLVEDTNLDIKLDLRNFEAFVVNDTGEVLDFGRVKDVGRLN
jgi:hypothetical protein